MENTRDLSVGAKTDQAPRAHGTRTRAQRHGLSRLLRADRRQIDGRSALGLAISAYKADLMSSLGGKDNLSVQEITLIELISRDWAILGQIDGYLLTVGLFSKRKKAAWPLLATRLQVEDGIAKRLTALGLSRRSKPVQTLSQLLNASPEPAQAVDAGI